MISRFYQRRSKQLLIGVMLLLPFVSYQAEELTCNNNIETWLPDNSEVRSQYEWFKDQFGAEEVILVGLADRSLDDPLIEAVAIRIEELPGIRRCWSPARMAEPMEDLGVSETEAATRLTGLTLSDDRRLQALVALLSPEGLKERVETTHQIRNILDYCQLRDDEVFLAGSPVVVAELDRLGNRRQNKKFFTITLLICIGLLYYTLREWRLTLSISALTIWSIQLTTASIKWMGMEMNFVLSALPVMVMVFTLAISIHLVHYTRELRHARDPISAALQMAWKPVVLSAVTTAIGLLSLMVSEIPPVREFGLLAAIGCGVALVTGLGLTPAVLTVFPERRRPAASSNVSLFDRLSQWIVRRAVLVSSVILGAVVLTSLGAWRLNSRINPLDFLPQDSEVVTDLHKVERHLTSTDSVEVVVDFGTEDLPFVERIMRVRALEDKLSTHPSVRHTMSLATFFPEEIPSNPMEAARLFGRALQNGQQREFVSTGDRYWRISARVDGGSIEEKERTFAELQALMADEPVTLTGIAPLLEHAQRQIFEGFWQSFGLAFLIITLVMVLALRSPLTALTAMLPNLTPICLVFGTLGWLGTPVDIGMTMTASIALGMAVDGTFHFLVHHRNALQSDCDSREASLAALRQTGAPILQAALIASIGMLALTLSNFTPTARFGWMMFLLLTTAVVGDLVLLPALLALLPARRRTPPTPVPAPRFLKRRTSRPTAAARVATDGLVVMERPGTRKPGPHSPSSLTE